MTRNPSCPVWQKAAITFSGTGIALMLLATLSWGRAILIPLAVAIFLTFVLSPIVRLLVRCHLPRVISVLLTTASASLLTLGIAWALTHQLASLTMTLPDNKDRILQKIEAVKTWFAGSGNAERLNQLVEEVESTVKAKPESKDKPLFGVVEAPVKPLSTGWSGWVDRFMSPAVEMLSQSVFAFVLVVFFLLKKDDIRDRFIRLVGDGRVTTTTKALNDASDRVSRFLLKQLLFNLFFGFIVAVGLFLFGVQYALLWGVLAAGMRYLPYVGTWIAVVPPTVYSLATTDAMWQPIGVLAFIVTLELVSNNLIEPFLYGKSHGVSEVAQLIAAGFWSFLWGPIGLVLSGPLTTCLLVLGKYVPGLKFLDVILGNEPSLSRGVMFFQRLMARDDDSAQKLYEEIQASDGMIAAMDHVVLPALQLIKTSERDGELTARDVVRSLAMVREMTEEMPSERMSVPAVESLPRLLIVPARDDIDAVASELLARMVGTEKWNVSVLASSTLTGELAEKIDEIGPDLVVIGSVLPGGIAHTRYMTKRIRDKHSELTLIVGRWGAHEEAQSHDPAEVISGVTLTGTLAETVTLVMSWRPIVAEEEKRNDGVPAFQARRKVLQESIA
ncbi:MAG: AI-2E family transporter [Gemmataceae bacterium]